VAAAAVVTVAGAPPTAEVAVGAVAFLVAALVAELRPVPLDESGAHSVSLAFVFVLAALILFGWQYAVLSAALAMAAAQVVERNGPGRAIFNVCSYALSALAAAFPVAAIDGMLAGHDRIAAAAFAGGAAYLATNVALVSGAIALAGGMPLRAVVAANAREIAAPFAIMGSIAALAASLWTVEPRLEALLAGPLVALGLYQRYAYRTALATRDAETDALTGLRNHRAFQTTLAEALAAGDAAPVALAMMDIDDFKAINDIHGHPVGDAVLTRLASVLRVQFGAERAFRIGGEEFAVLLPGLDRDGAADAVEPLHAALAETRFAHGRAVTVSAGVAAATPGECTGVDLLAAADNALLTAKRRGKNRTWRHDAAAASEETPEQAAAAAERAARLRAAEGLVGLVDAKDGYAGVHSQSVSRLAEGIAAALGLDRHTVDQVRIAGLLHDLGKIGVPDRILQKPGRLDDEEFEAIKEHSRLGFRLVEGLGIAPIDRWILHHHEWWNGAGYPEGLAGEDIPLGSRIILVADAFDAMTTDRPYRAGRPAAEAIAELRRKCWVQFDARVVAALERHLASVHAGGRLAA
jgi:diguanylate cyclase (GGDEF)-like protein